MDDLGYIKKRLQEFIRRYYLNELLKGIILFFSIWLLYFIGILLIEYFFWLSPPYRSILFWLCILVSAGLFYKFIAIPIAKLFRISKGLDEIEASRLIGKHFPEVNDKLLNVLQLQKDPHQSDLLIAGIAQKSKELKPVPFKMAVNFKTSLKYLKYAAFPVIIILAFILTGNSSVFSESYSRVIHYKTEYEPPAPFSFQLKNEVLQVEEGSNFTLEVATVGKMVPETVAIHFNEEMYYLRSQNPTHFQYTFQGIDENVEFYLSANGVTSRSYQIEVVKVPKLLDFTMKLNYPRYLKKASENIKGTGNITIPEGTEISWNLKTKSTEQVVFATADTSLNFVGNGKDFSLSKNIYKNTGYQIKTSNKMVKDHEVLDYRITVIKDRYPEIMVQQKRDTVTDENIFFFGKVSDDYEISKLNIVYFTGNEEDSAVRENIPVNKEIVAEFFYAFPGSLQLEKGKDYTYYFEVFDNDGIRGPKKSKSENFGYRKKSEEEVREEQLQKQGESIQNLSQSLEKLQNFEQELEELSRLQKEKEQLNFNDRKKLDNFLQRQKQQTEIMKNYSEKLKETLEDENESEQDPFKKELNERLKRNEQRLEENEELLEELQKYADKISREELSEKLEKLSKQNSNEQKNLEQLLELTKRYYVQEKTQKLASDLEKLSEKQKDLPEKDSLNTQENQKDLNKEFEDFQKNMDDLEKENDGLKKPFEMGREPQEESEIKKEQEEAGDKLEQGEKQKAGENQKKAAQKMKEMSQKMQQMQMMSQGEQLNVNIESMRQILDNLMIFSFEQEDLLLKFRQMRPNNPEYPGELRKQQVLKEHFQHIDDSLFALAVNNPMINEKITAKLTDIEFDINKSLDRLAQNEVPQGTASQQYVMTGTNDLALMLSDVLSNMQQMANPSMSPGGNGSGNQLQDIIMSQEELNKRMKEGMQEGEGEKEGEGDNEGEEGKSKQNEEGKPGKDGEQQGEEMSGKLFEIFKQQQLLKQQLINKLGELGEDPKRSNLIREMEQVERDILEKGFNEETLQRMNRISHRMMELENAALEQEEDQKRSAITNTQEFDNKAEDQILKAKEYFKSTEILNRQSLPLRQNYKAKVKEYFGAGDKN